MQIDTAVPGTVRAHSSLRSDYPLPADGPWNHEPHKVQWVDAATSLPCLIVRNGLGTLCGYVGVGPGHPLHGCNYDNVDVSVHGGLTYSDRCCHSEDEAFGICHVPEPGTTDDVWWFGFDCAHAGDLVPVLQGRIPSPQDGEFSDVYRDVDYVAAECTRLAAQLAAKA